MCTFLFCASLLSDHVNAEWIGCGFAYFSPIIDGSFDYYSWNEGLSISFEYGKIVLLNNHDTLFVLIDFINDTGCDSISIKPRCDDYFEFILDWDGNKKITPGLDRIYSLCKNETNRLHYRYYLGKGAFSDIYFSQGQGASGFGITPNHSTHHRIYEFSIPLSEVKKEELKNLFFGIKVVSKNPSLYIERPKNLYQDLSGLFSVAIHPVDNFVKMTYVIGERNMSVNGILYQMDTEPILFSKRSFLPIRYVVEPIGGIIQWNSEGKRLVVIIKELIIELRINDPYATVNGKKVIIEKNNRSITPLLIPPGRVFVPLRFIGESLGASISWNSRSEEVSIQYQVTSALKNI